jgi:C4-dicarboxylate transporter DctM subunit
MITPPVGNCLYVGCNIAKIKFEQLVKATVPYIIKENLRLMLDHLRGSPSPCG